MKLARALGIVVQAVVLGVLLFYALGWLLGMETGARIFRYQGF